MSVFIKQMSNPESVHQEADTYNRADTALAVCYFAVPTVQKIILSVYFIRLCIAFR